MGNAQALGRLPASRQRAAGGGRHRPGRGAPRGDHEGQWVQRDSHRPQSAFPRVSGRLRPPGRAGDGRILRPVANCRKTPQDYHRFFDELVAARHRQHGPSRPQPSEHHYLEHRERNHGALHAGGRGIGPAPGRPRPATGPHAAGYVGLVRNRRRRWRLAIRRANRRPVPGPGCSGIQLRSRMPRRRPSATPRAGHPGHRVLSSGRLRPMDQCVGQTRMSPAISSGRAWTTSANPAWDSHDFEGDARRPRTGALALPRLRLRRHQRLRVQEAALVLPQRGCWNRSPLEMSVRHPLPTPRENRNGSDGLRAAPPAEGGNPPTPARGPSGAKLDLAGTRRTRRYRSGCVPPPSR